MPRGPKGEKRPADVVGNAVYVMKIARGEIVEKTDEPMSAAAELGRKGGKTRARTLTAVQRAEIARAAAAARWKKERLSSVGDAIGDEQFLNVICDIEDQGQRSIIAARPGGGSCLTTPRS